MAKKPKAYLSGGMEYAKAGGEDWRRAMEMWIRETLRHSVFNPVSASEQFLARRHLRTGIRELKERNLPLFMGLLSEIVEIDCREIIRNTTYVICYWDRSAQQGAGTKGELTVARLYRKPVYLVTRMSPKRIPGWVLGCTTNLFSGFGELKLFLKEKFL